LHQVADTHHSGEKRWVLKARLCSLYERSPIEQIFGQVSSNYLIFYNKPGETGALINPPTQFALIPQLRLTDNISGCRRQPQKFAKTTGQLNRTNTCMKKSGEIAALNDWQTNYMRCIFFNVERSAKL
jgi:hypothetical protein